MGSKSLRLVRTLFPGTRVRIVARTALLVFAFGVAGGPPATVRMQDNIEFSVLSSKSSYVTGDTVLLAVTAKIKPYYYLYGNPVGPGGGRPVTLTIRQTGSGIRWLSVKKMKGEKIGPPFGDWVWAYRNETVFFCVGVVVVHNKCGVITSDGSIVIEGLLCREACRLQSFTVPFSFDIVPRSYPAAHFMNNSGMLSKYAASMHMIDLLTTLP